MTLFSAYLRVQGRVFCNFSLFAFSSTLKFYWALNRRFVIIYNIGTVTQHGVISRRLRLDRSRRLTIVAPINAGQCRQNHMKQCAVIYCILVSYTAPWVQTVFTYSKVRDASSPSVVEGVIDFLCQVHRGSLDIGSATNRVSSQGYRTSSVVAQ